MSEPIYLDGFSTLPLAAEAKRAMLAAWERPGNAASPHAAGEQAARLVEAARCDVARLIGAAPGEIIFTSGATEANNLAILGATRAIAQLAPGRRRIVVSAIEHKAVLEPALALEASGYEVLLAPVDSGGRLDLRRFEELVDDSTLLVSVMAANNETGVIQPVAEVSAIARASGALVHCDAAQAVGKIPIDVIALDLDYLSLSGHKLYGPMGVGALYVSAGAPLPQPLQWGGGQERGVRPGTQPVALIAGLGAAAAVALERQDVDAPRARAKSDRLAAALAERQLRFEKITDGHDVLPGSLALSVDGISADDLCVTLARRVQLSTGSACTSGQLRRSHVLEAMGFSEEKASSVVRIFCHRYVDIDEIETAAAEIAQAALRTRVATGEVRQ
jgi:cysteine desulfurase